MKNDVFKNSGKSNNSSDRIDHNTAKKTTISFLKVIPNIKEIMKYLTWQ